MSRIAYVNGRYVPRGEAAVHVEDRGYQFADGVYEVCAVFEGMLLDESSHLDRLARSLSELNIAPPVTRKALRLILREVVARNRLDHGILYFQITRGVARRDHAFPPGDVPASLVVTAKSHDIDEIEARARAGVAVVTVPDNRWKRCDIKSIALLPNILAKQQARGAGADEAWFVDDRGRVTEGSSTNAWIVNGRGDLVTRGLDHRILSGITRAAVMSFAAKHGLKVVERAFSVDEAERADEAFITSATAFVTPVVKLDDRPIGNGHPGRLALSLRAWYFQEARRTAMKAVHKAPE